MWAALKACDCDGITALATELDESYLSLSELREGDPSLQPQVEAAFAKARAAAAVEFAAKGIPDEAIYEAAAAAESAGWLELRAVLLALLADDNHAEPGATADGGRRC